MLQNNVSNKPNRVRASVKFDWFWTEELRKSFKHLKHAIGNNSGLTYPRDGYGMCLITNVSDMCFIGTAATGIKGYPRHRGIYEPLALFRRYAK